VESKAAGMGLPPVVATYNNPHKSRWITL